MPPPEQAAADVWTVGRILDWTTGHLKQHGSDTPRLDAEILLAHARKCPRIQLYVQYGEPVTEAQRATMRDLVKRRALSEPVAYLVGHREFFGLDFQLTKDVLIPRPETETLVLELLTDLRKRSATSSSADGLPTTAHAAIENPKSKIQNLHVLDVCTGSGCIAVAAAVNLPEARVTAIDNSAAALAVARENGTRHKVDGRVRCLEGDLFAPLGSAEQFDAIVSNPPYVANAEMEQLPADIRLHEPAAALRAGPQGLDVISRLITGAPAHLAPGGLLLIEFSPEQAAAVTDLIVAEGEFDAPRVLKDAAGKARVIATRRKV